MMTGTPASQAAARPRMPALLEWVWTIWGRSRRNNRTSDTSATGSRIGRGLRRIHFMTTTGIPADRAESSRLPSGPASGPVTSVTSNPRSRSPRQERIVFSWAPPTMSRVMTCMTLVILDADQAQPLGRHVRPGLRAVLSLEHRLHVGGRDFAEADLDQRPDHRPHLVVQEPRPAEEEPHPGLLLGDLRPVDRADRP